MMMPKANPYLVLMWALLMLTVSNPGLAAEVLPAHYTNRLGMRFVLIQPGIFQMGSAENEPGRQANELQHWVRISRAFYLQTTEVTQAQWEKLMKGYQSGSYSLQNQQELAWKFAITTQFEEAPIEPGILAIGPNYAVHNLYPRNAVDFLTRLSQREGLRYRLPSEAEWEYAARAGSSGRYYGGEDPQQAREYVLCRISDPASRPDPNGPAYFGPLRPVGSLKPNPWGLYDMLGGVREWVGNEIYPYPQRSTPDFPLRDPARAQSDPDNTYHFGTRGGDLSTDEEDCRLARRYEFNEEMIPFTGFRALLETESVRAQLKAGAR